MSEPHILTTLRAEREKIEGTILTYEANVEAAKRDLGALNRMLALAEPEGGAQIAPYLELGRAWKRGEIARGGSESSIQWNMPAGTWFGRLRQTYLARDSRTLFWIRVKQFVLGNRGEIRLANEPVRQACMTRQDVLLAILAASGGRNYTPAQIQKGVFLVTENLPALVTEGRNYHFEPYDYGPFDKNVYVDCETLSVSGEADVLQGPRWKYYTASDEGVQKGLAILERMAPEDRKYVHTVSEWVRSISFDQLVKSIYEKYPHMKANSIFRG
jgi:uncharacterized protein